MPVNTNVATAWEEQAHAAYMLDPDTGLPAGGLSTPLNRRLPNQHYLGSRKVALDGTTSEIVNLATGSTVLTIRAVGGEVYYEINGVGASSDSPGYIPQDNMVTLGPLCNLTALWLFSSTAGTVAHFDCYHEQGNPGSYVYAAPAYWQKVRSYKPIAYWPLWETSGTKANCLINPAQNGTYSSDVSGWPPGTGIGDGNTAPGFDGTNDYVDVNTATLEGLWNAGGTECSILIWAKVFNVGVWTDGNFHGCYRFRYDASNYAFAQKTNVNNQFQFSWDGGGTIEQNIEAGMTTVDWQCLVMTRSETADEIKYYRNGNLLDTDMTIGAWIGGSPWEQQVIGSVTVLPNAPWHGWLAHCAVWFRPLGMGEIAELAIL